MPNANYRNGARLERLAKAQLERAGYTVIRSAGSKGPVDLVAWDEDKVRLIQVKAYKAACKADVEKLRAVKKSRGATVELWERDSLSDSGWEIRYF